MKCRSGAAGFTEQALDRDGDLRVRGGLLGMERREKARAAGADDQDVGVMLIQLGHAGFLA
jgi:hypothetical protein